MIRDRVISARVNAAERAAIAQLQRREERSLGDVIRRLALQAARASDQEEKPHAQPKAE